ncbi:MAG: hypothetical protein OXF04_12225, partial [bacterium]|nr:hypothetical protein [bacterium]
PVAATIAARLALEAVDPDNTLDWSNPDVWRDHKTVDLACGSGTLLTAVMTEMKRRAELHGADQTRLADLQKVAVEEVLKGLDINPVSLQLAATQLMSGNTDVKYRKMGLHQMPYGPQPDGSAAAGTLELLARREVLDSGRLFDDAAASTTVKTGAERYSVLQGPEMDDAADAALRARIVIMNPPFTNRTKAGEKFDPDDQKKLRHRMDTLEQMLVAAEPSLDGVLDKNSIRPMFETLAGRLLPDHRHGAIVMIAPTVIATAASAADMRLWMAERFHLHTICTCHQPGNINLSQNTAINESIFIFTRYNEDTPATKIISLDRLPDSGTEADLLFKNIEACKAGELSDGWGEVSAWPAEQVQSGDWTAAIWRSPALADAAASFARHKALQPLGRAGLSCHATGQLLRGDYRPTIAGEPNSFWIMKSKGADAQSSIEGTPDELWVHKKSSEPQILTKAGHLLLTAGQRTSTGRVTSIATNQTYVGNGWVPVTGLVPDTAKPIAVFLNSTPGRLLIMRNPGRTLEFPSYSADGWNSMPIPDLSDSQAVKILVECWEETRHEVVPQFRDGYTPIRRRWDEAVCDALGWDIDEIAELGELLAREPRVSGVAYGQWKA